MVGTIIRVSKHFSEGDLRNLAASYGGKAKIAFGDNNVDASRRGGVKREYAGGQASQLRSETGHYWDDPRDPNAPAFGIVTTYYDGAKVPPLRQYRDYLNARMEELQVFLAEDGILILPCDEMGNCTIGSDIARRNAEYTDAHFAAVDKSFGALKDSVGAKEIKLLDGQDFWKLPEFSRGAAADVGKPHIAASSGRSDRKTLFPELPRAAMVDSHDVPSKKRTPEASSSSLPKVASRSPEMPAKRLGGSRGLSSDAALVGAPEVHGVALATKIDSIFEYLGRSGVDIFDSSVMVSGKQIFIKRGSDGSFSSFSTRGADGGDVEISSPHDSGGTRITTQGSAAEVANLTKSILEMERLMLEGKLTPSSASLLPVEAEPLSREVSISKPVETPPAKSNLVYSAPYYSEESFKAAEEATKSHPRVRVINLFGDDEATKNGARRADNKKTQSGFVKRADGTCRDQGEDSVAFGITTTCWTRGSDGKKENLFASYTPEQYAAHIKKQFDDLKRIMEEEKAKGNPVIVVVPSSEDGSHNLGKGQAGLPESHLEIIKNCLVELGRETHSDLKIDKRGTVIPKLIERAKAERSSDPRIVGDATRRVVESERSGGFEVGL